MIQANWLFGGKCATCEKEQAKADYQDYLEEKSALEGKPYYW